MSLTRIDRRVGLIQYAIFTFAVVSPETFSFFKPHSRDFCDSHLLTISQHGEVFCLENYTDTICLSTCLLSI